MKNTYVNDFAKVLTTDQVTALNKQIFDIEQQTSVQFAVVLVDKLPENLEIQDYSLLLARKWHVGKYKNGLVYVAVINQHKQRLEVASGLDTVFTTDVCQSILDAIKPSFKAGDYNAGLQTLVSQVQSTLSVTTQPQPVAPAPPAPVTQPSSGGNGFGIAVFIVAIIITILVLRGRRNRMRNNGVIYNQPGYYNNQPVGYYNGQPHNHSGVGTFIAGAAAGYAATRIIDDLSSQNNNVVDNSSYDNSSNNDSDNTPSNWGNWGSDNNDSSSSSDSSSSDDSSSNDDSGFSGSDSSGNDSGASSGW